MGKVERKLIDEFVASDAAFQVEDRLRKFAHRLKTAGEKFELYLTDDSTFNATSRKQLYDFLGTVINLPVNGDDPATEGYQLQDFRTEPLQELAADMEALTVSVIPLFWVSLEADRRFFVRQSIMVQVIYSNGDSKFVDLAGRHYPNLDRFFQTVEVPFGFVCYLEPNCVLDVFNHMLSLQYKMVGKHLALQNVADVMLSALNFVGSFELMAASSQLMTTIGLSTVVSSVYLMARGVMGCVEIKRLGGFQSRRNSVINFLLTVLNLTSVMYGSIPYSIGTTDHLNGLSKVFLSFSAGIDLIWLFSRPSEQKYNWIDV